MTVSAPTRAKLTSWIVDSGATSSATYDERDCVNIQNCNIQVIAAGRRFTVKKKGTALVNTIDEKGNCAFVLVELLNFTSVSIPFA